MVSVSAILLGAGESKRMGVNKLFLPWRDKTVIEHCLDILLRSKVEEVVVVLSDRDRGMGNQLKHRKVKVVINPRSRSGMSTSIRRGLRAIDQGSQGILIALGDQPLLRTRTVNAIINAFARNKGSIVLPSYRGRRGHPVLFDRCYERGLSSLRGDVGGKSIVKRYSGSVIEVRTKSEAVLRDIDTWIEYRKELRMMS